jgi:hypothetical protein
MISVRLPSQLAGFAGGRRDVLLEAKTLSEVFERLDEMAPMIRSQIFDGAGEIRQFVGIFVDGRQVVESGDRWKSVACNGDLTIAMSVAGG